MRGEGTRPMRGAGPCSTQVGALCYSQGLWEAIERVEKSRCAFLKDFFSCSTDWRGWSGSKEMSGGIIQLARTRGLVTEAERNLSLHSALFLQSEPFPSVFPGPTSETGSRST